MSKYVCLDCYQFGEKNDMRIHLINSHHGVIKRLRPVNLIVGGAK